MTIATQQSTVTVLGTGNVSTFSFPFVADSASFIEVTYTDSNGISTILTPSQYTLYLNPVATGQIWSVGGTVTYPISGPPIPTGTSITITRTLPYQQLISIANQGDFSPQVIEEMGDILEMQIQQVAARGGAYRGIWATGIQYNFGDIVQDGSNGAYTNNLYVCAQANISGTWATDLANGDWVLIFNTQALSSIVGTYLPIGGGTITGNLAVLGTSTLSNASPSSVTPSNGSTARTLAAHFSDVVNLYDWLSPAQLASVQARNLAVDCTTVIQNWINYCITNGKQGYAPSGTYLVSSQIVFQLALNPNGGCTFVGDGVQLTIFSSTSTTSPNFYMYGTCSTPTGFFYPVLKGIGFQSNIVGTCFQLGQSSFNDQINEAQFDITAANSNSSSSSIGFLVYAIFNCDIRVLSAAVGAGVGTQLEGAAFCEFHGVFGSGSGGTAIYITGSYSVYGNTFQNIDYENSSVVLKIDNTNCFNNTFIGGQWGYTTYAVNATQGHSNYIFNPNPAPSGSATLATFLENSTGIVLKSTSLAVSTPSIPASTTPISNTTGQTVRVMIQFGAGNLTVVTVGGAAFTVGSNLTSYFVTLNPNETIALTYSTVPSYWVWTAIV